MRVLIFWGLLVECALLTGCAAMHPVQQSIAEKKDSTIHVVNSKDSTATFFKETVTPKVLPGATVNVALYAAQIDSLVKSLKSMPAGVARTIYYADPQLKASLQIALDSLGRIAIKCQALDQAYFEKSIEQKQYSQSLVAELNRVTKENSVLKQTVTELKKPVWQRIGDFTHNLLLNLCLIIIGIGTVLMFSRWILGKLKTLIKI